MTTLKTDALTIDKTVSAIMDTVCGGNWIDIPMTDAMHDAVCKACPYRSICADHGICYACPNWEDMMGEDC